jgi:energy-coupling factor transport system permease protein
MHTLIRIVSFLVFAAFVALGNPAQLVFAAVLVGLTYYITPDTEIKTLWGLLRRMRWLFLSLLVVYLWFTPGQPLLPAIASQPTLEGVQQGLLRISALTLLTLAASLLLQSTTRETLIAALYRLVSPLRWLGVQPERMAVRITLTLGAVTEVQQLLTEQLREHPANISSNPVARISAVSAGLFQAVIAQAEKVPCTPLTISEGGRLPAAQWLVPIVLCGALWYLG